MNDALILWEGAGVGSRSGVQIGSGKLQKHSGKLLKNSVQNCSKNKIHWENQTFSIHSKKSSCEQFFNYFTLEHPWLRLPQRSLQSACIQLMQQDWEAIPQTDTINTNTLATAHYDIMQSSLDRDDLRCNYQRNWIPTNNWQLLATDRRWINLYKNAGFAARNITPERII